jgi:hypothetical protein
MEMQQIMELLLAMKEDRKTDKEENKAWQKANTEATLANSQCRTAVSSEESPVCEKNSEAA